ncbi:MAG: hypothetical protein IJT47_02590 [Selenomonadaceae bacterium]|nr:hypothetical protein [Selenomonadaceae bacterium]
MADKRITTWVPVSTGEDLKRLSKIKKRSISDILRELTYDFLKRNAARLAQIKDLPPKAAQTSTIVCVSLDKERAQDLKKLANADEVSTSQILREEAEKYVADNRTLLEK